jgi:hypothetical protein
MKPKECSASGPTKSLAPWEFGVSPRCLRIQLSRASRPCGQSRIDIRELPTARERRPRSVRKVSDSMQRRSMKLAGSDHAVGMGIDRIDHGQCTIPGRFGDRAGDET